MKIMMFILFAITSFASHAEDVFYSKNAEYSLYFGGWSHHSSNKKFESEYKKAMGKDFVYNENHRGLGIQYANSYKDTDHIYLVDLWYMKDSNYQPSYQLSAGYKHRFHIPKLIDSVDVGVGLSVMNRSVMAVDSYISQEYGFAPVQELGVKDMYYSAENEFRLERKWMVAPLPYVTVNVNNHLALDFTAMFYPVTYYNSGKSMNDDFPEKKHYEAVLFFRVGYRL